MLIATVFTAIFATLLGFTSRTTQADPVVRYQGKTAREWYRINVRHRVERDHARSRLGEAIRARRRDRRLILHRSDVVEAIRLAATTWHVDFGLLYRRALCETGGSLNPYSKNRSSSASGVFQFLVGPDRRHGGTWGSTPYAGESVWSPYANSLAAAWMEHAGRGSEWVCTGR